MAGIGIITGFDLSANSPIDNRFVMPDQPTREAISWKYAGLLVYQTDVEQYFYYDGTTWISVIFSGTPGPPGSVWFNDDGVPLVGIGVDGDYYLDNLTGDVYQKQSGAWVLVSNIMGPQGEPGADSGAFASIAVYDANVPQVITVAPVKINQFELNGPQKSAVADFTNQRIIIATPGDYVLYFDADLLGVINKRYQLVIYVNGVPGVVLGTFNCASNTTPNISVQCALTIPDPATIIELYASNLSGGSDNLTLVTARLGVFAVRSKGDVGKALIHTEHDIVLNETNMAIIASGVWSPEDPYSASIIADSRSNLASPASLSGNKTGHSISYNGTVWSDNGIWRGPTGGPGSPGTPGANGATVTGGTRIRQGPYVYNSEILGTLGGISGIPAFYGHAYLGVAFSTSLEIGWKVKLEFTAQCRGHNFPATVRYILQRSDNAGVSWITVPGAPAPVFDFRAGDPYHTTVHISFVDAFTAANTAYMYRLVGYNSNSSQDNYFSTGFGYCLTLVPT